MSRPLFVSATRLARALDVSRVTIGRWIADRDIRGIQHRSRHYTDERPRLSNRGRWLVELDSVVALLERMYAGEPVPLAIRQRLRALAAKSPQP